MSKNSKRLLLQISELSEKYNECDNCDNNICNLENGKIYTNSCPECCIEFKCNECNRILSSYSYHCQKCDLRLCFDCNEILDVFWSDEHIECLEKCVMCNKKISKDSYEFCEECGDICCFNCIYFLDGKQYCNEECIPAEILTAEKEKEDRKDRRKNFLIRKLAEFCLELRLDSKLCRSFINDESNYISVEYVVERMAQMKYLFEYCNIRNVMKKINKELEEKSDDLYIDFEYSIFDEAEFRILEKKGGYPLEWPWITKIINKYKENFAYCLEELRVLPPRYGFPGGEEYRKGFERFYEKI